MTTQLLTEDELPLLDEPFPVEFANSLYGIDAETFDFLGDRALVGAWFEHVAVEAPRPPRRLSAVDISDVQTARNAIRQLLADTRAATASRSSIGALNRLAERAPSSRQLQWTPAAGPSTVNRRHGRAFDVFIAEIATACIEFVAGSQFPLVRQCPGTGCSMFFVQQHHRRQFCNETCAHRARQARYYRRTLAASR